MVSQNGNQIFAVSGNKYNIPYESRDAGVPISVNPNQNKLDSGCKGHGMFLLRTDNPVKRLILYYILII